MEIKHVDFSYVEGKPILKDVCILAPKGKMTAVLALLVQVSDHYEPAQSLLRCGQWQH